MSAGAGDSLFGTFRLSGLSSLRGRVILRGLCILRFLLPWLAIAYQRIISGPTLTLSPLLRLSHLLLQILHLNRHSFQSETFQDLILVPDQLTAQLRPPAPLIARSILRLCILVRHLNQILNRVNHYLPLRLPPSIDPLLNLGNLTSLIPVHCYPHYPQTMVGYLQESRKKNAKKTTDKLLEQFQLQLHRILRVSYPLFCLRARTTPASRG